MDNINIADFELYLNWAVSILKTQDPQVIQSFKEEANLRLDRNSLNNILVAALHHLADSDLDAFRWALHNYDSEFYTELRRRTVVAAARQLIRQGCIPGQDFSSLPVGGLLVTPRAKEILWKHTSPFSEYLLREILHTLQPA
ncbi:hypothetical protein [Thermocoleostomius sinensis]|jgi:hypothetical protein|uniref:Uncharacterized protein n=1 Tax=Thermocoleostomius sinensis A174 TaxID=2016057 RepID=A0A9E8ZJX5_9CYAN|nr:hypothetical protein [Thermocoleostomius sinensis]WAL62588.1 hypothetical protein OXH18_11525 [Thermocoleostomius sinensis A174]